MLGRQAAVINKAKDFSESLNGEYEGRNRHNVEWIFEGVIYFGWPNQPSSGIMGILHWDVFLCSILPEIRKTS